MAVDKLVDSTQLDADLTSVANAIRTKGGTSASLAFPAGFASAIAAIPTGGGDPNENLKKWAYGTLETVDLTGVTSIGARFRYVQDGANFTVFAPDAVTINGWAFAQSSKLTAIYCPVVQSVGSQAFYNTGITTFVAPEYSYSYGVPTNTFAGVSIPLTAVDVGNPKDIGGSCFNGCSALDTLIIRGTALTGLANTNAFKSTPFASGNAGGTLYVPSALISSYQSASNWSTILGYANNQIKSIESTHTDPNAPIDLTLYYADGTPIT